MYFKYIICLGNPGNKYLNTPHNVGYEVAEILSEESEFKNKKNLYLIARRKKDGIRIVKPLTYMNLSGVAVSSLGAHPSEIIVVCDDFALPLGKIRCRLSGSDGGHNGLKSVIANIGQNFPRLRIGVGPVPPGVEPSDFVLTPFKEEMLKKKNLVIEKASKIIESFISNGITPGTWNL